MRYGKPSKNKKNINPRYFLEEEKKASKKKKKTISETKKKIKSIAKFELEKQFNLIEEGIWDNIKHFANKFGALERGGKLRGKAKWVAKADAQFERTLGEEANKTLKALVDEIMEQHPEWPNQKDHWEFQRGVIDLSYFYDTLKANVKKYNPELPTDQQEEGAMSPDVANGLVHALRTTVRYLLDRKLNDVYKHFKESIDNADDDVISEIKNNLIENDVWNEELFDEIQRMHEADKLEEVPRRRRRRKTVGLSPDQPGTEANPIDVTDDDIVPIDITDDDIISSEDIPPEEEEDVLGVGKVGSKGEQSAVIKGLKGKALPIILSLLGGAGIAAEVAALATLGGPQLTNYDEIFVNPAREEIVGHTIETMGQDLQVSTKGHGLLTLLSKGAGGGNPMDVVANVDKIAATTGHSADEIIASLSEEVGKKGEDTSRALQLVYDYQKSGGEVSDFVRPGTPDPKFIEFVKADDPNFAEKVSVKNAGTGFPGDNSLLGINVAKWTLLGKTVLAPIMVKFAATVTVKKGAATAAAGSSLAASGILGALGWGALAAGTAVALLRVKGRKSSRAQILDDLYNEFKYFEPLTDLSPELPPDLPLVEPDEPPPGPGPDPEPDPDVEPPPPLPDPTNPPEPPADKKRLGLARMDDTGTKLHISRRRKPETRNQEREFFQAAQDQAIVGNRPPADAPADSGELYTRFGELPRPESPRDLSYTDLTKMIKGRSRYDVEPYFAVDGSYIRDSKRALKGLGIRQQSMKLKQIGKALLDYFVNNKEKADIKLAVDIIDKNLKVKLPIAKLEDLLKVATDYGLVQPGGELSAEQYELPLSEINFKMFSTLEEAEQYDAELSTLAEELDKEDDIISRWSDLAGIKK